MIRKIYIKLCFLWRKIKWKKYQNKYGFGSWHMIPKASKPYTKDIVKYIVKNKGETDCIVEFGCGLCDILANRGLKKWKRTGVEKEESVYQACRAIYKNTNIKFIHGSFMDIGNEKIDWFIAVNFIHNIPKEEIKKILYQLAKKNNVQYFILDEVSGNYPYTHNFDFLVRGGYCLVQSLGPYKADQGERYIRIYRIKK
ncbi:MAG: class I SAM-dependent methyltransferase [Lachnospiraceae bacterium]|nr:class I SAM-dependent methyltransferase [Lachnospiraceae bacterium]